MAAEAYELAVKRVFDDSESPSAQTSWQVIGATDYANARATLDASLPTTFTFPSSRVAYLDSVNAIELLDDEFWEFTIGYRSQPKPTFNDTEFEFDVAAPNDRIYYAISTTAAVASGTAPDFKGAIGVRFGSVEPTGVEPLPAESTFSITKHWAVASVTQAYQMTVEGLVGKINSGTFNGRAAGSVRLLGVRGRQSGDKFPISYTFGVRQNRASKTLNGIPVAAASGWSYEDVYRTPIPDATAKQIVWQPAAVYTHQLHATDSFAGLSL